MNAETATVLSDIPLPRENTELVGHEAAERLLANGFGRGRLGHAWMISGPRGIGKATLAYRLARFVLAAAPAGGRGDEAPEGLYLAPAHPTFRRVAAGSHADLLTLERSRDERSNRLRSEIVVNDARRLATFFGLTAGEGGWRVAIVDSADELNRSAANSLLKVLEEPPGQALILLVAHTPGRVPPTIRSRCRKLQLRPLDEAIIGELLARQRPGLTAEERQALARLSQGSAGAALMFAVEGGLDLYRDLLGLLQGLPQLDVPALYAFCERFSGPESETRWRTLATLLEGWLVRLVRAAAGAPAPEVVAGEAALRSRLSKQGSLEQWIEAWEKIGRLIASTNSLNLDRKQVLAAAFTSLERVGRG